MFDENLLLIDSEYFLTKLKEAVSDDNAKEVLELIELKRNKTHRPYTWSEDFSSTVPNNTVKRNELGYWYQLLFWIVRAGSINVCDAVEGLNIYTPGHIYTFMLQNAIKTPLPHLIDRLLLHVDPKSMLFSNKNALSYLFVHVKVLTKEHWCVVDKLINDGRSLSDSSLLHLLEHKDTNYILELLENCRVSLTDPAFMMDLLEKSRCSNANQNLSDFLKFVLQMPSSCLSYDLIDYVLSSSDSYELVELLCSNGEIEFLKHLDLTEFDLLDLVESYIDKDLNKGEECCLRYISHEPKYRQYLSDNEWCDNLLIELDRKLSEPVITLDI